MADWVDAARHFLKKLDDEVNSLKDHISYGGCGTHEDYRYQVGRLHGINYAKELIRTTLKGVDEHDD